MKEYKFNGMKKVSKEMFEKLTVNQRFDENDKDCGIDLDDLKKRKGFLKNGK